MNERLSVVGGHIPAYNSHRNNLLHIAVMLVGVEYWWWCCCNCNNFHCHRCRYCCYQRPRSVVNDHTRVSSLDPIVSHKPRQSLQILNHQYYLAAVDVDAAVVVDRDDISAPTFDTSP